MKKDEERLSVIQEPMHRCFLPRVRFDPFSHACSPPDLARLALSLPCRTWSWFLITSAPPKVETFYSAAMSSREKSAGSSTLKQVRGNLKMGTSQTI